MCQIHFLGNLNGNNLRKKDLIEFISLMYLGNENNNDAFGLFNDKYSFKDSYDFDYRKIDDKKLKKSQFVVGHNRYTTLTLGFQEPSFNLLKLFNGELSQYKKDKKDHHPFSIGDLMMVHNGRIYNYHLLKKDYKIKTKIKTDSYIILYIINKFLNQSRKIKRIDKLKDAIQRTTPKLIGYYSIFLYDKASGTLIYFKKDANFYFQVVEKNILIGSTNEKNLDYCYSNKKRKKLDIEDNKIYQINLEKDNPVNQIGEFTPNKKCRFNFKVNAKKNIFYDNTIERGWLIDDIKTSFNR